MIHNDLPPEFRRRKNDPDALPIELPLEDDSPPLPTPELVPMPEQRNPEPYLRRS